jgi:hypothetical protein
MLRAAAAGNLTVTETTAGKQIDGTPVHGVEVRVHCPQATGTTPTLDTKIQESNDNSAWNDLAVIPQITAAGEYRRRIATSKKYLRAVLTVAGTTPNFGAAQVGFEAAGEQAAF